MRMSAEFLPRLLHVRDLDELEARVVHAGLELLVALPIAVGFLHDDRALEQQSLEHPGDVELRVAGIAHAEGDVLEVAEQREVGRFGPRGHGFTPQLRGCRKLRSLTGVRQYGVEF
jgi:hypothetical protein